MPLLRAQRGPSIESTIKALVGQSADPSPIEYLKLDQMVAQTGQQNALAEKARAEVEQSRQQEAFRSNPQEAQRYASMASGAPLPLVQKLEQHLMGATEPGVGPMPDGSAMGAVPVAAPEMPPQQALQARTALASLMANRFATGKTNADQLTQAGGNLQTQGIRSQMAQTPDVPTANMLATAINQKVREPFQQGALGVVNQETGALTERGINPELLLRDQTTRRGQDMQLQGALARAGSTNNAGARPPAGYRTTPDGNLEAIPGGPADTKIQGQFNQDTATLTGSKAQLDRLAEAANKLLKAPGLERIYGLQGKLPNVPGMAGADAQAQLETLKSQIGFSVLQAMRDASKTGGALGAVTEKELGFLQNNLAALDKAQSVEQARESLQAIIKFTEDSKERLGMAYNMRHGQRAAQKPAAPAVGEVRQGYRFKGGNPADRNSWEQVQ